MASPTFDVIINGKPLIRFEDEVGLYWSVSPKVGIGLSLGLFVLEPKIAKNIIGWEITRLPDDRKTKAITMLQEPWNTSNYPSYLPTYILRSTRNQTFW